MKKTLLVLVAALFLMAPQNLWGQNDEEGVAIESLAVGEGETKVIATGYGATADEAVKDAMRIAVSEAVGAVVSSTTIVENDEIIKDEVLSLSHGFVKQYRKIAAKGNQMDGYEVTIVAVITQRQLIQTLTARGVKVEYDAGGIFAQYNAWDRLKQDELAMVERYFGPEALAKRSSNVYNYHVQTTEPRREGDYYYVDLGIVATQNSNYDLEMEYFKALMAELSYEAVALTYQMPTVHLEEGLPEAQRYVYKTFNGVDRKGRNKFKTHLVDICEIEGPGELKFVSPSSAYGGGSASQDFYTRFVGMYEEKLTTRLLYKKYHKLYSSQDISRLNDRRLPGREEVVFDLFQKSYTPYVFAVVEEANMLTPYRRITLYKFTNPQSLEVVRNYLTWMFGEVKCDIVFQTTEGENMVRFEAGDKCVYDVVNEYDAGVRGDNVECQYEGYAFLRPVVAPCGFVLPQTFRFTSQEFSVIRNIELVPHVRTNILMEVVKKQ